MTIHELKATEKHPELAKAALELVARVRSGEVTGFLVIASTEECLDLQAAGEIDPFGMYGYAMWALPKLCEMFE